MTTGDDELLRRVTSTSGSAGGSTGVPMDSETLRRLTLGSPASGLPLHQPIFSSPPPSGYYEVPSSYVDRETQKKLTELEGRIAQQNAKVRELTEALKQGELSREESEAKVAEYKALAEALQKDNALAFITHRVNAKALQHLLASAEMEDSFLGGKECQTFVMSVDIRRSTELMLKAKSPEHFARFISDLCEQLIRTITDCYGVFDKFTGDGVLAFFPDFFSGEDAGVFAVQAAMRCHEAFARHYKARRRDFSSILLDTGLGIGIDFGVTRLLRMADGLTVVGQPVVYACRFASGPPHKTYLNEPAYEKVSESSKTAFLFTEDPIPVKNEGLFLAYSVSSSGADISPRLPKWAETSDETKANAAQAQ